MMRYSFFSLTLTKSSKKHCSSLGSICIVSADAYLFGDGNSDGATSEKQKYIEEKDKHRESTVSNKIITRAGLVFTSYSTHYFFSLYFLFSYMESALTYCSMALRLEMSSSNSSSRNVQRANIMNGRIKYD